MTPLGAFTITCGECGAAPDWRLMPLTIVVSTTEFCHRAVTDPEFPPVVARGLVR